MVRACVVVSILTSVLMASSVAEDGAESRELTPRAALGIVAQAVKAYRGTWEEHALIHASLRQLEAAVDVYEQRNSNKKEESRND